MDFDKIDGGIKNGTMKYFKAEIYTQEILKKEKEMELE